MAQTTQTLPGRAPGATGPARAARYDLAVFIGRFQPFHLGHLAVIRAGLAAADAVLVLVGSTGGPRSLRNPLTFEERRAMIEGSLDPADRARVPVRPLEDRAYNDALWIEAVQEAVRRAREARGLGEDAQVALVGHAKDRSSYYLKLFPQWGAVAAPNHGGLGSTAIREAVLGGEEPARRAWINPEILPEAACAVLREFVGTEAFGDLCAEQAAIRAYRRAWAASPYPPVFVTVDACVVQSGHVLLVRRKARPGMGLWALPGGFLGQGERIEDAAIRELREETRLKVPAPVLRGCLAASRVFDDPHRDPRGRVVTHAFLVRLPAETALPEIRGGSDAAEARWWPLAEIGRDRLHADHADIIAHLTALL